MLERDLIRKQVSARLVAEREKRDLSQEGMARVIGVSGRQYQRWEDRVSTPGRLYRRRILDKVGVDLADLFPKGGSQNGSLVDLLDQMNGKLDQLLDKDP